MRDRLRNYFEHLAADAKVDLFVGELDIGTQRAIRAAPLHVLFINS